MTTRTLTTHSFALGIDFGTSGARAIAIDSRANICAESKISYPNSQPTAADWRQSMETLLAQLPIAIRHATTAIAIDGTSATVVLCAADGTPLDEPIYYNDKRGAEMEDRLRQVAPPNHVANSSTSSLAKFLWWQTQSTFARATYFLHQADWLAFLLHGQLGISDYHNALKLGYDVAALCYPNWLRSLPEFALLPRVVPPGTPVASVGARISDRLSFPPECQVCAGTTDSIAAFIASGANAAGDAVTSLGSTLVLKLLSDRRVEESASGIYSHRWGNLWLTGGASNTGGAVLRHFFSDEELAHLSQQIDPQRESPLHYYPLLQPGDRFPVNDPNLAPQLDPKPGDRAEFLHGLLESMARIEARGYQRLQALGATSLHQVFTAGGGAKNPIWTTIRQRQLQVPVLVSPQTEAAFGAALLAQQ